jgi:hypothetical protein
MAITYEMSFKKRIRPAVFHSTHQETCQSGNRFFSFRSLAMREKTTVSSTDDSRNKEGWNETAA